MLTARLTLPQADALTFNDALDLAWARAATRIDADARSREARVRADAARSIFPGAPFVSGTYDDDHALGYNLGYTTYQGEIGTPLWLPGEGTATEKTALADARHFAAEGSAGRQDLAFSLLSDVVTALAAGQEERLARLRLDAATRIAHDVGQARAVGEVGSTDADAALAARAEAEISLARASVQARLAEATLAALTGTDEIPSLRVSGASPLPRPNPQPFDAVDPSPDEETLIETEPHVAAGRLAVEAARDNLRLVRLANRDDPDIGIEAIKDKQFGAPWDARVGVVVHIPLPSYARNAPRIAAAETVLDNAEAQLVLARRNALLRLRGAERESEAAATAFKAAAEAAQALERRRLALTRAWHAGEIPLIELLRAQDESFAAQSSLAQAEIDLSASSLRTRLATGAAL